jgi:hypothetical protein
MTAYNSSTVRANIEALVAHNVSNRRMFTAYDISKLAQDMLKAQGLPIERHRNIGSITRDLFDDAQMPNYDRQQVDVAGERPFVYFHYQDDPADYGTSDVAAIPLLTTVKNGTINITGAVQAALPAPNGTTPGVLDATAINAARDAAIQSGYGSAYAQSVPPAPAAHVKGTWLKGIKGKPLDEQKRLRFPKKVLDEAGFAPGDSVYLNVPASDARAVKIEETPLAAGQGFSKKYVIDGYGNLRATLKGLGFDLGDEFQFASVQGQAVAQRVP